MIETARRSRGTTFAVQNPRMNRFRRARVFGAGALSAGVIAYAAAQTSATKSPAAAPPPAASSSAPASKRPHSHFFVGEVTEIVAGQTRFSVRETLRDGAPKVTFFTATPETTVLRGKEKGTFADLRVNDHVTIKYGEGTGEKQAIAIRITPSAKPKAPSPTTPSAER
jgi:hypothetical protein